MAALLERLGWQARKSHNPRGRAPAWVRGYARAAEWAAGEDGWADLPAADSYVKAAERYTESDLIYMCVKKLADISSSCELALFDPNGERDPLTGMPLETARLKREEHPFYTLWERPNRFDSRADFIEAMVTTLLLSPKGSFTHLDDGRRPRGLPGGRRISLKGEPVAMWWLIPESITVVPDAERFISEYRFNMGGERTIFEPDAIMRVTEFNPLNRYNSLGRVRPANLASAADIASQMSAHAMFKNAFRPSAIIESDRAEIDETELDLMERLWEARMKGVGNWHKMFPLWAGFKIREWGFSPRESESVPQARLNRVRVFGVIGVHPGLVFSEDVNWATAKVAEHVTRAWTVAPLLEKIAGEITSILPHWPGAPPAEAHFVNVVPVDKEIQARIESLRGAAAASRSRAIKTLIESLGPESGFFVAKSWGVLPGDTPTPPPAGPSSSFSTPDGGRDEKPPHPSRDPAQSTVGVDSSDLALNPSDSSLVTKSKASKAGRYRGPVEERNAMVERLRPAAYQLAGDLVRGGLSLPAWGEEMRSALDALYEEQYKLGLGRELDSEDEAWLRGRLSRQNDFLTEFERVTGFGEMSPEAIGARAYQYFGSSVAAFERAKIKGLLGFPLRLPELPGDGNQECRSYCRCWWEIEFDRRLKSWLCYWEMAVLAEHCFDCRENNLKWSPLVIPLFSFPGLDNSLIPSLLNPEGVLSNGR
jgi:hypothetical protein